MPKKYEQMRDAMIREGKSVADAKKFAAIQFYKETGRAVSSVDKPTPHHKGSKK